MVRLALLTHMLRSRHTCTTHKARLGFTPRQIQDLLGHEKVETSFIYVHLATTDASKLMEQTSL